MQSLTISAAVRPGRIAVLVDSNDPNWASNCRHILEYFSQLWGGYGNIIIPTDGAAIAPLFWRILDTFDPDYIYSYQRTGSDIEMDDPAHFDHLLAPRIASWEEQTQAPVEEQAKLALREQLRKCWEKDFEIAADLQHELRDRLAPFHFEEWIVERCLSADDTPNYPESTLVEFLPDAPLSAFTLLNDCANQLDPLWYGSVLGLHNSTTREQLRNKGWQQFDINCAVKDINNLVSFVMNSETGRGRRWQSEESWASQARMLALASPASLTMTGLGHYRRSGDYQGQEKVVAVCGNKFEDFCLYFGLSRIRHRVVWVLPAITEKALSQAELKPEVDHLFHFASDLISASKHDPRHGTGVKLVSSSLEGKEISTVLHAIETFGFGKFQNAEILDCLKAPLPAPLRLYEKNNAHIARAIQLPNDRVIQLFETPKPKSLAAVDPGRHRWLTEVTIKNYHLPRHPAVGWHLFGASDRTTKDVRMSKDGPCYFAPSFLIMGGQDTDANVSRPSIKVPTVLELFNEIARYGNLRCEISDKGFYGDTTINKFGGLAPLADFLRSDAGTSVCSLLLDKTPNRADKHDVGVLLDDRRYLDFTSIEKALGNAAQAQKLIDNFSQKGIFYRGFIFQCSFCRAATWFPAGQISDSFTCPRCHRSQVYTSVHWKFPEQPRWYHQLDEIVYQALIHDMHVPTLALDWLRKRSKDTFLFTPELAFSRQDEERPYAESDMNFICDGVLGIGEAKKSNRLAQTKAEEMAILEKYEELVSSMRVTQLVLATAADDWSDGTKQSIDQIFSSLPVEVILLNRQELYSLK
jgi:hypothetical protein